MKARLQRLQSPTLRLCYISHTLLEVVSHAFPVDIALHPCPTASPVSQPQYLASTLSSHTTMAVSGGHLAALAHELCESIFYRLPGSDLKNLRLTSNKLSTLSESFFFEEIVLIPTQECLTGFSSILASSNQGRCVRKLNYDERWIGVFEWLSKRPSCTPEELGRISLMQADFFDKFVDVETQVKLLYTICKILPNLTVVEVFESTTVTRALFGIPVKGIFLPICEAATSFPVAKSRSC